MTSLATLLSQQQRPDLRPVPGFVALLSGSRYIPSRWDRQGLRVNGRHLVLAVLERTAVVVPLHGSQVRRLVRHDAVLCDAASLEWRHEISWQYGAHDGVDPTTGRRRNSLAAAQRGREAQRRRRRSA